MHARMDPSLIARRDCTVLKYGVFNDRRPVKVLQSVFFNLYFLSSDLLLRVKEYTV